ncbi:LysR family transcriptional regulator [Salinisphaera sp.]|uniref:LysR family transcriptional regulator n=1 Tax=Salinisphaera sp. TaxID=1914330 RepID=UPI002D794955|nr:LysR family transcriptional regulator [Salinisphaera sp.]HET7314271.1 LysR family transcriptional regulator [Salinisphaera sp.]
MPYRTLDLRALQSLVTVVDIGSFTGAARQLHYSQSAISMQIRRLENELGVSLLKRESRSIEPTRAGGEVLGYAREMLRLNGELRHRLAEREIGGTVRLGLPVDYAPYIPSTLTMFAERYPLVEMEVRSELSVNLIEQTRAGDIDMAIVTREPDASGGTLLRREALVWVAAPGTTAYLHDPIPLSLSPEGVCAFRAAATARLDAAGQRWRIAYESPAFAAQRIPVGVGLAVTVAIPSLIGSDLEILAPETTGLPELPAMDIRLHRKPGRASRAADCLAELIVERIRDYRHDG